MADKTIYVARHGERLDFVDPSWSSTAARPHDPPLTARGKDQATALGRKLRHLNIRHVYSSPFTRCVNTAVNAAAMLGADVKVNVEPGACEWLNYHWFRDSEKGPVWRDVDSLADEFTSVNREYDSVFPMSYNFDAFPETLTQLMERCMTMVRVVTQRVRGDGNILFVGHCATVEAVAMGLAPGTPVREITYCSLTECIPTAERMKYTIGLHCDTSFLMNPQLVDKPRYI